MKRLCVFAHWDRDNIIDRYVIYYLKALREVCQTIIFVSDSDLDSKELSKLDGIADYKIAGRHGEYDFGSYKRGFSLIQNSGLDFDELLWVNDSCYGPFYSLKSLFEKMEKEKCDFWGLTEWNFCPVCKNGIYTLKVDNFHIQTYFINFKKNVTNSTAFNNFINSITSLPNKNEIVINYEVGLSKILFDSKFVGKVMFHDKNSSCNTPLDNAIIKIHDFKFPLLKTNLLKNEYLTQTKIDKIINSVCKQINYDKELISCHTKRMRERIPKPNFYRKVRYKLLRNCSYITKYRVILFEKALFKVANFIFFNKLKKF